MGAYVDTEYKGVNFEEEPLSPGDYIDCRFSGCRFAGADLSELTFDGCVFENCDLSLVKLGNTAFRKVEFRGCKMLGMRFDQCNPFGLEFHFTGCVLNLSSFFRLKIKKTRFEECKMVEVDLVEADLEGAVFDGCDLSGTMFDHTNLEKADFRMAQHYIINPETNRIRKAKFSWPGLAGLLARYGILIE